MRIVSMFALCFALSACTEEETVTVLEPVAVEFAADAGVAAPTVAPTSAVVAAEGEEQAPAPLPPSVAVPSDASAGK